MAFLDKCRGVPESFVDSSTGLRHDCGFVCHYDNPKDSPKDCRELCPDLWTCLVTATEHWSSAGIATINSNKNTTPGDRSTPAENPVWLYAFVAVIVLSWIGFFLAAIFYAKWRRSKRSRTLTANALYSDAQVHDYGYHNMRNLASPATCINDKTRKLTTEQDYITTDVTRESGYEDYMIDTPTSAPPVKPPHYYNVYEMRQHNNPDRYPQTNEIYSSIANISHQVNKEDDGNAALVLPHCSLHGTPFQDPGHRTYIQTNFKTEVDTQAPDRPKVSVEDRSVADGRSMAHVPSSSSELQNYVTVEKHKVKETLQGIVEVK